MSRTLTLLFRRDPSRDRLTGSIKFEGYAPLWPDGKPVAVGMDAFCKHGLRLLGLGKHLTGCHEKLVKLICVPLSGRDADLTRIPGHRVRRFYVQRTGLVGRLHFLDGTPTASTFELGCDDPRVLNWVGMNTLEDGGIQWIDLAAVAVESAAVPMEAPVAARQRFQALEV